MTQPSKFKTNLERWRYYLSDFESPDIFINWTFYTMISAALQRRVCIGGVPQSHVLAPTNIYPNMYVVFIAEPGIGKTSAGSQAKYLFASMDKLDSEQNTKQIIKRGPDSITVEALTKYLHTHYTVTKIPKEVAGVEGKAYTHSSLALFNTDEMSAMIREDTHDLVKFLTLGWDSGDFHRETKTAGVDVVKNMCITMLGSATPAWIKDTMATKLLNEGFSSRCVFVYADKKRFNRFLYKITPDQNAEMAHIKAHVTKLTELFGEVKMPKEVFAWCENWYEKEFKVVNNSRLLKDYYARKRVHLMKLAMAFHFAESTTLELTIQDFESALQFLEVTELNMDRALCTAGTNPIYGIASSIYTYLEKAGKPVRHNQIIVEFYNEGDMTQLTEALTVLVQTGKIESVNGDSGIEYYIRKAGK